MELKIGKNNITHYNSVNVTLKYDSIASVFSFNLLFDPEDISHRELFKPGSYQPVTIRYKNELLITGTILGHTFTSTAEPQLMGVTGYSKSGVLEDCQIPKSAYPLQSNNINLKEITERILKPFNLKLVVDPAVSSKVGMNYKNSTGGDTQTAKGYISELTNQQHIVVTHNENGDIVFTEVKTAQEPIWDFKNIVHPCTKMTLGFDGQRMHSELHLQKQASKKTENKAKATTKNPYAANTFRPAVMRQSSGNDTNTALAAEGALSDELKGITLQIELDSWEINGKLVRPNNMITVTNPELFIYQRTKFFIEQVEYKGTPEGGTATLTCYIPEVYNSSTPKNIFD